MVTRKKKVIISLAVATLATVPVAFGVWAEIAAAPFLIYLILAPALMLAILASGNVHQPTEVVYFLTVFLVFFGLAYAIISGAEFLLRYIRRERGI